MFCNAKLNPLQGLPPKVLHVVVFSLNIVSCGVQRDAQNLISQTNYLIYISKVSHHTSLANFNGLDEVADAVSTCTKCDLCQSRTNAVPGIGDKESKVLFVGEAPGRSEDLRGRPFVGRAGQILTEALEKAGVSRRDVYITNTVKCRPPKNRNPNKTERESCKDYLDAELRILKPRVICILGNIALKSLLGDDKITSKRGSLIQKDDMLYFPTIHPAAVLYNPQLAHTLEQDIKKLFDIIRLNDGTVN